MQILELHAINNKIIKNCNCSQQLQKNENLRILLENYKNHENHKITYENHEIHKNIRIP